MFVDKRLEQSFFINETHQSLLIFNTDIKVNNMKWYYILFFIYSGPFENFINKSR